MAEEEDQNSRTASQSREHSGSQENHGYEQDPILQTLTDALQRIAGNVPQPNQPSIVKEVHKYYAEEFRGREDDVPTKAEYWLEQLERIFDFINPTPREKLQGAVALLKEEAYRWWASVTLVTAPAIVNCEFFLKEFRKRYVGDQYMDDRDESSYSWCREIGQYSSTRLSLDDYQGMLERWSSHMMTCADVLEDD